MNDVSKALVYITQSNRLTRGSRSTILQSKLFAFASLHISLSMAVTTLQK